VLTVEEHGDGGFIDAMWGSGAGFSASVIVSPIGDAFHARDGNDVS